MLMVDGVVLISLDEPEQMWDLDGNIALVGNQCPEALGEIDDVRHVGKDVVGSDEISLAILAGYRVSDLFAEKVNDRFDALGSCRFRHVRCRFEAEASNAPRRHVLQQV